MVVATVRSAHDVELSDCAHAAGLVLELMCGDQVHHTKVCTSETYVPTRRGCQVLPSHPSPLCVSREEEDDAIGLVGACCMVFF